MNISYSLVLGLVLLAVHLAEPSAIARRRTRELMNEGKEQDTEVESKESLGSSYHNARMSEEFDVGELSRELQPPPFALVEMQPPPISHDDSGYAVPMETVAKEEEGI